MTDPRRLDEDEFTAYLTANGYPPHVARALVDQALEDDDTDPLEITAGDGSTVLVEVDGSRGYAGLVEFILPGGSDDPECE